MEWQQVPQRLRELYAQYWPAAIQAADAGLSQICTDELGFVSWKTASALKPVADAFDWPQKFVGGPNPLTATLLGAALGSGLGYAGGSLAESLFPSHMERGKARRNLAMLGGLAGAAPFAYGMIRPALQLEGWQGLLRPYTTQKVGDDALLQKCADAGGAFAPTIHVDQFNRVVLSDPNLPLPVRAATSGLLESASIAQQSERVSPMDIASAAVSLGASVGMGMLAGKAIGMLAGLNPGAQQTLQRTGMLAGVLLNVIPRVF